MSKLLCVAMKINFELSVDPKTRQVKILFTNLDRSDELEEKLLKIFVEQAKTKGIKLVNPTGHLECGTKNSWENYEIVIDE